MPYFMNFEINEVSFIEHRWFLSILLKILYLLFLIHLYFDEMNKINRYFKLPNPFSFPDIGSNFWWDSALDETPSHSYIHTYTYLHMYTYIQSIFSLSVVIELSF